MDKTKKYDVPLVNLDYSYISKCENVKELEKIVKILRSGDEGIYPHLEQTALEKLEKLNPQSRVLRQEAPVIKSSDLKKEEWSEINQNLQDWSSSMKNQDIGSGDTILSGSSSLPPIRKGKININKQESKEKTEAVKQRSPMPKSYTEWDKIDIDKELEDLDKEEEKVKETISMKANQEFEISSAIDTEGLSREEIFSRVNREKDKGNEALKSGDVEEAIVYYTRSLSLIETPAVYNNRALAYLKISEWKKAVSDCNRVLTEEPYNIKALLRSGTAYIGLKDVDSAEKSLESVLTLDCNNKKAQDLVRECTELRKETIKEKMFRKEKGRRMVIEEVDGTEDEATQVNGVVKEDKSSRTATEANAKIVEIPVNKQNGMHEDPKDIKNTKMKKESDKKTAPKTDPPNQETKKAEKDIWSLDDIENFVNINADVDLQAMSMGIVNTDTLPEKPEKYQNRKNYSNYDADEDDDEFDEEIDVEKPSGLKISEITDEKDELITKTSTEPVHTKKDKTPDTDDQDKEEWSKTGARPKTTTSPRQQSQSDSDGEGDANDTHESSPSNSESSPESKETAVSQEPVKSMATEGACSNRTVFKQEKLPSNLLAVKEEGSMLFRTGQYGKAILRYTNLIDELEKDADHQRVNLSLMYSNRAACYLKTGHSKAAMTDCQRSLDIIPHTIKPLLRRAAACEHLEKYRQAYIDYRHILSIDTSVQLAQSGSSRCQNILQQLDGTTWREKLPPFVSAASWEVPEIILDVNSGSSNSSTKESSPPPEDLPNPDLEFEECKKFGNSHVQKGEYQQAVECYCKCIALSPDNPVAYTNRALCYLRLNQPVEATLDCDEALKLDNTNHKALYRRALAKKMLLLYKDSLQDLTLVLKLDPKNAAAQKEFNAVRQVYKEEWKHKKESTPPTEPVNTKKPSRRMKIEEVEEEEEGSKDSVHDLKPESKTTQRSDSRKSSEEPQDNSQPDKSNKNKKQKITEESQPSKIPPNSENLKLSRKSSVSSKDDEMQKIQEDLDWLEPKQPEAPLSKSAKRRMKAKAKKSGGSDTVEEEVPAVQPEVKATKMDTPVESKKKDSNKTTHKDTTVSQSKTKESPNSDETFKSVESDTNGNPAESTAQSKSAKKRKQKQGSKEGTPVIGLPVTPSSDITKINATPYEFMTAWNSLKSSKDTKSYTSILRQVPPTELPKVISNKLDGPMLTKILQCVKKDIVSKGEDVLGYQILNHLSSVNRFSMISMMLSTNEKKDLSDALTQLGKSNQTAYSQKDLDALKKSYDIK